MLAGYLGSFVRAVDLTSPIMTRETVHNTLQCDRSTTMRVLSVRILGIVIHNLLKMDQLKRGSSLKGC